ncbi:hypothetical protein GCM10010357_70550 [Streptomyces luteireticuli]|uniref:Uncharacterized protein n=1 Tax=Streptomyces luteireticuli TaxID=173858 RepID=A0ABN0Z987_9ACTN
MLTPAPPWQPSQNQPRGTCGQGTTGRPAGGGGTAPGCGPEGPVTCGNAVTFAAGPADTSGTDGELVDITHRLTGVASDTEHPPFLKSPRWQEST